MLAVVFPPFAQRLENSESSGLLARLHLTRSFPQSPSPLLRLLTILTGERGRQIGDAEGRSTPYLP